MLSSYDPVNVPFFSDELYRYLHWSEVKSKGWDRKINYTMKEYRDLYDKTQELRQRLEKESGDVVKAIDLEKMAYALGKHAQHKKEGGVDDENDKALKGPSPNRRRKRNPEESNSLVSVCRRKGPRGSPTFDELGYELDYELVAQEGIEFDFEKQEKEERRKAEIMGILRFEFSPHWDERVARDLGIAYHEVGMEEYEQWRQRGFKIKPGEFENPSQEERDRILKIRRGSLLRKGSKRR